MWGDDLRARTHNLKLAANSLKELAARADVKVPAAHAPCHAMKSKCLYSIEIFSYSIGKDFASCSFMSLYS